MMNEKGVLMASDSVADYNIELHKNYDVYRKASSITVNKLSGILGKNKAVLSLGCGTGSFEATLSEQYNIVAIDASEKMLAKAIEKGINAKPGDMRDIKYCDNTFDAVYAIQSFHHVANNFNTSPEKRRVERLKVIAESYRVLKDEGVLVIIQSDPEQNKAIWFWHYFPEALERKLMIQPTIKSIKEMMQQAGFKEIQSESYADFSFRNFYDETGPLKKEFRAGYSEFSYLTEDELKKGCQLLKKDIENRKVCEIIEKGKRKFDSLGGNLTMVYGRK